MIKVLRGGVDMLVLNTELVVGDVVRLITGEFFLFSVFFCPGRRRAREREASRRRRRKTDTLTHLPFCSLPLFPRSCSSLRRQGRRRRRRARLPGARHRRGLAHRRVRSHQEVGRQGPLGPLRHAGQRGQRLDAGLGRRRPLRVGPHDGAGRRRGRGHAAAAGADRARAGRRQGRPRRRRRLLRRAADPLVRREPRVPGRAVRRGPAALLHLRGHDHRRRRARGAAARGDHLAGLLDAQDDEGQQLRARARRLRDDGRRDGHLLGQDGHADREPHDGGRGQAGRGGGAAGEAAAAGAGGRGGRGRGAGLRPGAQLRAQLQGVPDREGARGRENPGSGRQEEGLCCRRCCRCRRRRCCCCRCFLLFPRRRRSRDRVRRQQDRVRPPDDAAGLGPQVGLPRPARRARAARAAGVRLLVAAQDGVGARRARWKNGRLGRREAVRQGRRRDGRVEVRLDLRLRRRLLVFLVLFLFGGPAGRRRPRQAHRRSYGNGRDRPAHDRARAARPVCGLARRRRARGAARGGADARGHRRDQGPGPEGGSGRSRDVPEGRDHGEREKERKSFPLVSFVFFSFTFSKKKKLIVFL